MMNEQESAVDDTADFLCYDGCTTSEDYTMIATIRQYDEYEMEAYENWMKGEEEYMEMDKRDAEFRAQWFVAHPYACKACDAMGWKTWYENHGPGLSEPMREPCDHCLGEDKCPHCGSKISYNEETDLFDICPECKFNPEA